MQAAPPAAGVYASGHAARAGFVRVRRVEMSAEGEGTHDLSGEPHGAAEGQFREIPELAGASFVDASSLDVEGMLSSGEARFDHRRVGAAGRLRSCVNKEPLGRHRALRAARVLRGRQGDDVRAYACPFCSRWHVGHPPADVV